MTTNFPVCPFVEYVSSEDGYRRALSSTDLPEPGTIVSLEKPIAIMNHRQYAHKYCANCLLKFDRDNGKPGKRCLGGCQHTFYCSRGCQREHFLVHKYTCKSYSKIVQIAAQQYNSSHEEEFPWEDFMLSRNVFVVICQLAGVSVKEKRTDLPLPPEIEELYEGPTVMAEDKNHTYKKALSTIIASSFGIDGQRGIIFFLRLLNKFRFNNFGVLNDLQQLIASGIFPRGSILNHSCDPNCILIYEGSPVRQIIKTIKPVLEGDELFHSYTDLCQPTSVRQPRLLNMYLIRCNCERCQGLGQWKEVESALVEGNKDFSDEDANVVSTMIHTAQKISTDFIDGNDTDQLAREYNVLRKALSIQKQKLGRYNLERYKTECLILNVTLLQGRKEVLSHAEATVDFLSFVCNKHHPLLLLQEQTLLELYTVFGKP